MKNQIIQDQFETILKSLPKGRGPVFRGWLESEQQGYKVYLRITRRYINGKLKDSIDLSSIEVHPDFQRKGIFSAILAACEKEAQNRDAVVYVESVLNDIVLDKLRKENYTEVEGLRNCFWKEISNATTCST